MRFIGGKAELLSNIQQVIYENIGKEEINSFCDIFSGTSCVARYFKNTYKVYSNDLMYFSYVLQRATIQNNIVSDFKNLRDNGIDNVFEYLNTENIDNIDKRLNELNYKEINSSTLSPVEELGKYEDYCSDGERLYNYLSSREKIIKYNK